jgi:hypothetical protein
VKAHFPAWNGAFFFKAIFPTFKRATQGYLNREAQVHRDALLPAPAPRGT